MAKKYRKKPVVITAQQWWPPGHPQHDPTMLSDRKGNGVSPPDYRRMGDLWQFPTIPGMGDDVFLVRTLEGDMRVEPGSYIVTGVKGERYPVRQDIFEATYEEVIDSGDAEKGTGNGKEQINQTR